jgi:hypothetical protein
VREMSISENYEGEITAIRSNISRFSRGTREGERLKWLLKPSRVPLRPKQKVQKNTVLMERESQPAFYLGTGWAMT